MNGFARSVLHDPGRLEELKDSYVAPSGARVVCAIWGLSRTDPTSLSRNWDLFPCPRLSPAPGRVVQVTW